MKLWGFILNYGFAVVNLFLFCFWLCISIIEFETPHNKTFAHYTDVIQLQLALIEVAIILVAIALTFLGVFGYRSVLDSAKKAAIKTAKREAAVTANKTAQTIFFDYAGSSYTDILTNADESEDK